MKNGIVYIAFLNRSNPRFPRDLWLKELEYSAKTVKNKHPDLPITLFTDKNRNIKNIDQVKVINFDGPRVKPFCLWDSPYQNTLYLDTDTAVVGDIQNMFNLMERFDLAASFDHLRVDNKKAAVYPEYAKISEAFSEFNGGVILFRKSDAVKKFFKVWRKNYEEWKKLSGLLADQPSFRVSIWQSSDLKFYVLPPEYDLRTQGKRDGCKKRFPIEHKIYHWHEMYKGIVGNPYNF